MRYSLLLIEILRSSKTNRREVTKLYEYKGAAAVSAGDLATGMARA